MERFEVTSEGEAETAALGRRLGALLEAGDVVVLEGGLGAGKTRLAEGIARGLGVDEATPVPSPTFTIVNEHEGRVPLLHADLYRIGARAELLAIGWEEYLAREAVLVVEWLSMVVGAPIPGDRIEVTLTADGPTRRRVRLRATGPRSASRLAALGL